MQGVLQYEENELLTAIAGKDTTAYAYLFDTYYNTLVYFSHSIIQDQHQAEDIATESLVKLWQSTARFESIGKLRGYLFTLARNASLNYQKYLRVRERNSHEISGQEEDAGIGIEALMAESDLMRLVYEEIARLPETYRQVVELLYLQDMSSADAAAQLGISMENLRQRKGRAIKELKTELLKKGLSNRFLSILFF
ncbi:RNA polymerase sigma-70 factor (ECF subfamily) [Chitinophaga skermanii]|uniref:RNA polymerase sigma-70 factor (ECF subfamily) n=1 Tax=Chitinophaga skermanii TaxID=331697 RepID=A0A327QWC0_9BACT|nr:sigma-70 family RNA polymerase sigma factor [Chitinophaga skermanii]RAJ08631.1 RNA polymerase sigma-70 factor (ECF subfamily) [Chitinophaga skermanii]